MGWGSRPTSPPYRERPSITCCPLVRRGPEPPSRSRGPAGGRWGWWASGGKGRCRANAAAGSRRRAATARGRAASARGGGAAQILRGKHKPTFTPHLNSGDCVVVVNAARVKLTGRKLEQKRYFRHTGYMGHERFAPLKNVLEKRPERVIEKAVWGMLPKTTLSRQKAKQMLKVYAGPEHPHAAQQPEPLSLAEAR